MGASSEAEPGDVVAEMIRERATAVIETEPAALAGEDDGVHQHRSQVRRLRDVLAATRASVDPGLRAQLEPLLAAWGRILGAVRDAEVRAAIADEALTALGIHDGPVRARLVDAERAEYGRLLPRLTALREEPRFEELFAQLRRLPEQGTEELAATDADADDFARELLESEARRVRRAARRIDGSEDAYHRLRKSARRLRSVAVATAEAADLEGESAHALAKAAKRIHGSLGDHRDQSLFVERLDRARTHGVRAGESAAEYDALLEQARAAAADGLHELRRSVERVRKAAKQLD